MTLRSRIGRAARRPATSAAEDVARYLDRLRRAGSEVEDDVYLHPGSQVKSTVSLGRGARINGPAVVRGRGRLSVGRWAAIGEELRVITSNHPMTGVNVQRSLQQKLGLADDTVPGQVTIGPATWVGDRVTLLPGAHVAAGVVLAAGAVVTQGSIPPFVVAGGVPARVIRRRFDPDQVDVLLELAWWDWDDAKMRRNLDFFRADVATTTASALRALVND